MMKKLTRAGVLAAAPAAMAGGGPTLDLTPDDITISAAVDAKFVAE